MRLRRLEEEFAGAIRIVWKAFLLRPEVQDRSMEEFVAYTKSWGRPSEEAESGRFRPWTGIEGPPTHSVPPHFVSKAAALHGRDKFLKIHNLLLDAYFWKSKDITSELVLRSLWLEAGLESDEFPAFESQNIIDEIFSDHREAIEFNVGGVPAVRYINHEVCVVGAQPTEVYRRWFNRLLEQDPIL